MGTMLHEVRTTLKLVVLRHRVLTAYSKLTHNVHGPHDDKFYKFLSGLEEEYDALRRSGYAGEGFHSEGRRLGVSVSHDLPLHQARQKAAAAAEKRKQVSVVLSGGGRLGGVARSIKSPRELAAEVRRHHSHACSFPSSTVHVFLPIGCRA